MSGEWLPGGEQVAGLVVLVAPCFLCCVHCCCFWHAVKMKGLESCYMYVHVSVHMSIVPEEGVRSPGTELELVVNCLLLALGTDLRAS